MAAFAAPYARALMEVVLDRRLDAAGVDRQLHDFGQMLAASPELREVLFNPSFKLERRIAVLDALGKKLGLGVEVRNFIAILIRNSRLHAFGEVLAQYRREMDKRSGISEARITTARPLGADEKKQLEAQAAELAGGKINATYFEDKSLVGGVVLKIGSTVYDGSVRGRLERLKEQLIAG